MKIAILRKKYTFHGGAESFSSALVKSLADKGHEVHIFAIQWDAQDINQNIYFHKVPAITFLSFVRDLTFALSSLLILKRQGGDFDIIQTHDKTLYQDIYRAGDGCHIEWLKRRWRRIGVAGKISILLNPYHWLILFLEHRILKGRRFRKIIAISRLVKENIMTNYHVPAESIEVIYNGVDLEKFNPVNRGKYRRIIRQTYGIGKDNLVFLFVGSGFERKGVKYLIESMESVKEPVTLMIVGKGKHPFNSPLTKGGIKGGSPSKNHKIIFCGPQKDINQYYAAADVFVSPSIYEPFGNVHLEALASGLPVVTTKSSGAAEIISDGINGFVIQQPEDVSSMAKKIRFFIQKREQLESMREKARKLSEEFSYEKHIEVIEKLYEGIINERANENPP
jgi:UDP-glucose:(heptosyl)LPS alpha-1,3-glucosyltransferase